MLRISLKLVKLLDRRERLLLALLLMAALLMAAFEMVTIAAVIPFLSLAADPLQLQQNSWLAAAYGWSGFTEPRSFLMALGMAVFFGIVVSNLWTALTLWAQCRFSQGRAHSFAVRLMRWYAAQPYVYFLRRNSAELSKNALHEIDQAVDQTLMALLRLLTRTMVALAIVGLLIAFDAALAIYIALGLGLTYGLAIRLMQRRMHRLGQTRVFENTRRYKAASELLGAIKDVKLLGKERDFLRNFEGSSAKFTRAKATFQFLSEAPRYVLEAVAFGGVVLIAVYYLAKGESTQQVIPVLGLYAFAGYRLMPSLQQIFRSAMQLHFGQAILDTIYDELTAGMAPALDAPALDKHTTAKMLPLRQTLELDGIEFEYPGAGRQSLHGISLTLKANSTVGIVGPTGSGKSTLVDVILGLLRPDRGEIRIDGVPLTAGNLRAWQNNLGYVPQQIYLSDDTIIRNIAFGTPDSEIDMERVERAARTAQIYDFITTELPDGFDTVAGERGVRLSGGERQRIGIARALYNDPAVLVFDEATSALDSKTEAMLMEAIKLLAHRKTLIIISHRRETLDWADAIVELRGGRVLVSPQAPMQPETSMGDHT